MKDEEQIGLGKKKKKNEQPTPITVSFFFLANISAEKNFEMCCSFLYAMFSLPLILAMW